MAELTSYSIEDSRITSEQVRAEQVNVPLPDDNPQGAAEEL